MIELRKYLIIFIIITTVMTVFFSCEKEEEPIGDINLPPTPMLSESETWAVIDAAYLRLRERPDSAAGLVTTLWRGYVIEVLSRSPAKEIIDDEEDYWYQINYDGLQGWVFGSYLKIYDNKEEAEIKAREIRAE